MSQRGPVSVEINWAAMLFYAWFLAYGFFAGLTPAAAAVGGLLIPTAVTIILAAVGVVFGILAGRSPAFYRDRISVGLTDAIVVGTYLAVLVLFSLERLSFALFGDELSYAYGSQRHSIELLLRLTGAGAWFEQVPFGSWVQILSLLMLGGLCVLFAITRIEWKARIAAFAALLIAGRTVIAAMGGNGSPHPPLNLLPPFVAGALGGISSASFKLSSLLGLAVCMWACYRLLCRRVDRVAAFLLALSIGTIPILAHVGTLVEQSLWAAICFTVVLADIVTARGALNYVRLICFVSIAALLRLPAFLALAPILFLLARDVGRGAIRLDRRRAFELLAPALLFVPFLTASLVFGTPSTQATAGAAGTLGRVWYAIESGFVAASISAVVSPWWIGFLPFAVIPLVPSSAMKNGAIAVFAAVAVVVYYSIDPAWWGFAKYQAEYVLPVAVAGLLFLVVRISVTRAGARLLPLAAIALITLNLTGFVRMLPAERSVDAIVADLWDDGGRRVGDATGFLAGYPYELRQAYETIRQQKLDERTYSVGVTYGVLPEIMSGYSTNAVRRANAAVKRVTASASLGAGDGSIGADVGRVHRDPEIDVVVIGFAHGKREIVTTFQSLGWTMAGQFTNTRHGSTVVVMRRAE